MQLDEIMRRRETILELGRHRGVRRISVFGSVARGSARPDSDVDFLVEFEPGRSLLDQGGLLMDLQDLLGCSVDIVSAAAVRSDFREAIDREAVAL